MYAGIDPSTQTGVAILAPEGGVLHVGEVKSKTLKGLYRANDLARQAVTVLAKHDVELVAIEGYAYMNKWTLVPLVEIGTLLRYHLMQQGIPYLDVAPTSLKKFVSGKGNVKKEDMKLHAFKRWGFEGTNNEIDALGLAQMIRCFKELEGFTQAQKEVCKRLQTL